MHSFSNTYKVYTTDIADPTSSILGRGSAVVVRFDDSNGRSYVKNKKNMCQKQPKEKKS